jgi:hypothetical protein
LYRILTGLVQTVPSDSISGTGTLSTGDGMPVLANLDANAPDSYGIESVDGVVPLSGPPGTGTLNIPDRANGRAPLLLDVSPNDGNVVAAASLTYQLQFSAPMSTTSVMSSGTLSVTNANGTTVLAGSLGSLPSGWDSLNATLTLSPTTALPPGSYSLNVSLPASVVSLEGLSLAGAPLVVTTSFAVAAPIGAQGGSAMTPSGVKVNVPPGALSNPTPIQISPTRIFSVTNAWSSGDGLGYVFTPAGLTFNKPVTLTLPIDPLEPNPAIVYWDGNAWQNLGGSVSADRKSISVTITHFSTYAAFWSGTPFALYLPTVRR